MRVTATIGMPVVVEGSGAVVGLVDDAAIDVARRRLWGLSLAQTVSGGNWMRWSEVARVGSDAVFVAREPVVRSLTAAEEQDVGVTVRAESLTVIADHGQPLGEVADANFSVETGSLCGLVLASGEEIDAAHLIGGIERTIIAVGDSKQVNGRGAGEPDHRPRR